MENQNSKQTATDFCTKCGSELSPNTNFCVKCGTPKYQTSNIQPHKVSYQPLILFHNKTTRTLNIISTIYYVLAGISLLVAVLAIIASLTGEPSIEIFLCALVIAAASFTQGVLFSAIADIYDAVTNK